MRMRLIFSLLICSLLVGFPADAGAQGQESARGIRERLDRLISQVKLIEKTQEEILKQQDETIEEIKNLKVWALH